MAALPAAGVVGCSLKNSSSTRSEERGRRREKKVESTWTEQRCWYCSDAVLAAAAVGQTGHYLEAKEGKLL